MKKLIVLIAVVVILLSFCACSNGFSPIKADDVENMEIWTHKNRRELTKEECDKILEKYNQSVYVGKPKGEFTPLFGVKIELKNSKTIDVHHGLRVYVGKKDFYIKNKEFHDYLEELAEQLDKQP